MDWRNCLLQQGLVHSWNEQAPAAEGSFAKQWIGNDLDDLAGRHPQRGIVNARTVKRPSSD